jgi:DNA-directed RNA polymerase subunit RPC12/RpoP
MTANKGIHVEMVKYACTECSNTFFVPPLGMKYAGNTRECKNCGGIAMFVKKAFVSPDVNCLFATHLRCAFADNTKVSFVECVKLATVSYYEVIGEGNVREVSQMKICG